MLENCALTVCLRDVGQACRRLVGWREDLAQHNGLHRGGRGKRKVRAWSSKLAAAKTKGGCSFRQSTGERPTKTSSQGKPLDQEANAFISTRYIECAQIKASRDDWTRIRKADDRVSAHKDAVSLFERDGKGGLMLR
jgi:hypothetical protein